MSGFRVNNWKPRSIVVCRSSSDSPRSGRPASSAVRQIASTACSGSDCFLPMRSSFSIPLHARFDDREIVEHQLVVEPPQIARGIDAALGRHRVAREIAHDCEQRIAVAHAREQIDALAGLAVSRRDRVDELDLRVGRLLRLEQRGQLVDALIGHLHDAQLLAAALCGAGGAGVCSGALHEDLEQRGLAGGRQPQNADALQGFPVRIRDNETPAGIASRGRTRMTAGNVVT
jgi:hypothetical protein